MKLAKLSIATTIATSIAAVLCSGCKVYTTPAQSAPAPRGAVATAPHAHSASSPAHVGPQGTLTAWNGPISCATHDDIVIKNADIYVPDNGPTVFGSCDIVIDNSRINAGGSGVVIQGSGDVVIRNSHVAGGNGSIVIMGSGDAKIVGSHLIGDLVIMGSGDMSASGSVIQGWPSISGSGDFHDAGNNHWH